MRGTVASEYESSRSDYDTGMTWPHRRGSEDSIRSIPQARIGSPVASHRSVSPSRLRRPGSTASSESTAGVSSRHDMSALAATAAAAAENEAEVDVLELGGVGRDGSTRPLSPRVRDSHWLDGLSPRMAERGGSRLFPTHLTTPHSMGGGSVPGSPRLSPRATPVAAVSQGPRSPRQSSKEDSEVRGQGPRSPRQSSKEDSEVRGQGPRSPRQSSKEDPERQKRPPRAKERSKERREGTVETVALTSPSASPEDSPQAAQSGDTRPRLPSWAAPNAGRPDPPARSGNDDRSETGKWQQAAWATPLNPAVEAPTASQDNVEVASSAPSSRAASRLQELRAQLENSLRVAEQGLHADLRLLDQRLSAARRSGKESAESSSVKGK